MYVYIYMFTSISHYEISMHLVNSYDVHSVIFLYLRKAEAYIYSQNAYFQFITLTFRIYSN